MARIYDARGNLYAVATPSELHAIGVQVPERAEAAAATRRDWAAQAIERLCRPALVDADTSTADTKPHVTDGLLVGPFQAEAPFDLLIVNTDATLAERSGNGLTIFAQALTDMGHVNSESCFTLHVHHDQPDSPSPVRTSIQPAVIDDNAGFWLDLGTPQFGPRAVSASSQGVSSAVFNDRPVNHVQRLHDINPHWAHSVFVRIGNPHCVTLLSTTEHLPSFAELHSHDLHDALARIAFSDEDVGRGDPCSAGINLQWACLTAPNRIEARVFERGEGPTASSGTSASAVACAAWKTGLVGDGLVQVVMPGGTAPVRLSGDGQVLNNVELFGVARRKVMVP